MVGAGELEEPRVIDLLRLEPEVSGGDNNSWVKLNHGESKVGNNQ